MAKILMADDDSKIIELLEATLGSGHKLMKAKDGVEALKKAKDKKPDVIMLDLAMPRMNGLEVCRELKKDPSTRKIPVIMLTGVGGSRNRAKGRQAGVDEYIVKPFSPRMLLDRVEKVLAKKR